MAAAGWHGGCQDGMGVIVAFRVPEAPGITSGLVYRTEVEVWILKKNWNGKKVGLNQWTT